MSFLNVRSLYGELLKDIKIDSSSRNYLIHRLNNEGIKFVTVTLPQFSKWCLRCVEHGRLLKESAPTSIRWKGGAPVFLGLTLQKAISGSAPDLWIIRQICDYVYKLTIAYDDSQIDAFTKKYIDTDISLEEVEISDCSFKLFTRVLDEVFTLSNLSVNDALRRSRYTSGAFSHQTEFMASVLIDKHGPLTRQEVFKRLPGSVIGTTSSCLKDYAGYFRAYGSVHEQISIVDTLRVADLRFVPKDSRGPRVISKEPLHSINAQMGFHDTMCDFLTRMSRGRINFRDQFVNKTLALKASIDRLMATLDLREASDRIIWRFWRRVAENRPFLRWFFQRTRSTHVRLPNGVLHRLRKVANMGSGLCFPILSLTCYICAVIGVVRHFGCTIKDAAKVVYVYGDDLIVPTHSYNSVKKALSEFGLLTNDDKSFFKGFFRESCGGDYYHGVSVVPVRLKLTGDGNRVICKGSVSKPGLSFPIKRNDSRTVLQLERHCRELVQAGLFNTANYIYGIIEQLVGPLPIISDSTVPYLGRFSISEIQKEPKLKIYVLPEKVKVDPQLVCPYKGISRALKSDPDTNLFQPFHVVALRYRTKYKWVKC